MVSEYQRENLYSLRQVKRAIAYLAAIAAIVGFSAESPVARAASPVVDSDVAARWASEHRGAAIDRLLPPPTDAEGAEMDIAWIAIVRVVPTGGVEAYARLSRARDGSVTAHFIRPVARSIESQLAALYQSDPTISLEEAIRRVKVQIVDTDGGALPGLRRAADRLERLQGRYVFANTMLLDATRYEVWTLGGPQRAYISLLGADTGSPTLPLLRVLHEIRSLIESNVHAAARTVQKKE